MVYWSYSSHKKNPGVLEETLSGKKVDLDILPKALLIPAILYK